MGLSCFKAYDVRGKLGADLNEDIAYRIGRAFAHHLNAKTVAVGADIRLSSESLKQAVSDGIMDAGAHVIDLGLTGTEEVYFAAFHLDVCGGIEVTASHNPIDYNGMKFVGRFASPISRDSGLHDIQRLAEDNQFPFVDRPGRKTQMSILKPYVDHLLGYIESSQIRPLKIVTNVGNGAAGHVLDELDARFKALGIPLELIKYHHMPDGTFPNGIPNPLLPENRQVTSDAVIAHHADLGLAWDGDFDRCFFFDETGTFIEGYYIVGLLADVFLQKITGATVIHDPRLTWNTIDIVQNRGGIPVVSKTGHAFMKTSMRANNAVYGGEMSAHHYFRDFAYCDSGMIPWLCVVDLLSRTAQPLSQLVRTRMDVYPCSGELNYQTDDVPAAIDRVWRYFDTASDLKRTDDIDGLTMEFDQWRFNLRGSNTEPLLRLNLETRGCRKDIDVLVRVISDQIHKTG